MKNKHSKVLLEAIGGVNDSELAEVDELIQQRTAEKQRKSSLNADVGDNVITVNVSQATPMPVKRTRFSVQFAGLAAAVLLLVFGSVTALHFLSPERVVGPGGGTESESTQLPPNTPNFTATVVEITHNSLLVDIHDGGLAGESAWVPLGDEHAFVDHVFMIGDIIKVYFSGETNDVYPLLLGEIFDVVLVERVLRTEYTIIEWWRNGDEDEEAMQERIANSEHEIHTGHQLHAPTLDVTFEWVYRGWEDGEMINYIKAVYPNGDERTVVSGFGTGWGGRVFVADILGNGFPQFIFETSITSGLFTSNVHVHDFINVEHYFLSGYGTANVLSVENGRIMVTQHNTFVDDVFPEGAGGELAFVNGELTIIGGQRMDSTDFGDFDPDDEYAHDHDLEESELSARAGDLPDYYLRTNSTQITVSIPRGGNSLNAEVFLYDIEYPDDFIQTFSLERGNRKSFTGLTSARNYFIVVNGVDDDVMVLSKVS
jgi:hypothetical protein